MADIARLGFEARTDDLDKAKSKLEALVPAAKGAATAVSGLGRAAKGGMLPGLTGAATGAVDLKSKLAAVATGANVSSAALLRAGTSLGSTRLAAVAAGGAMDTLASRLNKASAGMMQADAQVNAYAQHLRMLKSAADSAKSSIDRLGIAANDNINRLQSTPGNIAAQFQDIGVTAAAGMSPFLIALQQGTQLSSAMAGGVGNLFAGFAQLFSMTTLLTIGLVGLAAAGLQMVDWMGLAQSGMYLLADGLEAVADMAVYLGGVMLIAFGPQIIALIWGVSRAIIAGYFTAMAKAVEISILFALANPWSAFVIGVGLAIAAIAFFARDFEVMGHNVIDTVKNAANYLINSFVGAYKGVKAAWGQFPAAMGDIMMQVVNRVIQGVELMINGSILRINTMLNDLPFGLGDSLNMGMVSLGRVGNQWAGAADGFNDVVNGAIRAEQGIDRVGQAADWASGKFQDFAAWLRSTADGMGKVDDEIMEGAAGRTPKTPKPGKTDAEKFDDIVAGVNKEIAALQMETTALGMSTAAAMQYRKEHELVQAALDAEITLTGDMAAEILRLAATWTDAQMTFNRTKFMTDAVRAHHKEIAALKQERTELGMTGAALHAYRYEMDLLSSALEKRIALSESDMQQIKRQAAEYGLATDAIDKFRERIEFTREALGGFFSEWFSNIREGQNIFEAFGNSVLSVLERILQKLTNTLIDNFLNNLVGGAGMFGGGGPSAALTADVSNTMAANPGLFANGGVFDGLHSFARGGAFTNGVVNKPTLFRFARGAALGEMGEAGPEAIMPLKRGSDGSLGVQVHGGGAKSGDTYVTIEAPSHYNIEGAINAETIVAAIKTAGEQNERKIKTSLPQWLEQYQRDGAVS